METSLTRLTGGRQSPRIAGLVVFLFALSAAGCLGPGNPPYSEITSANWKVGDSFDYEFSVSFANTTYDSYGGNVTHNLARAGNLHISLIDLIDVDLGEPVLLGAWIETVDGRAPPGSREVAWRVKDMTQGVVRTDDGPRRFVESNASLLSVRYPLQVGASWTSPLDPIGPYHRQTVPGGSVFALPLVDSRVVGEETILLDGQEFFVLRIEMVMTIEGIPEALAGQQDSGTGAFRLSNFEYEGNATAWYSAKLRSVIRVETSELTTRTYDLDGTQATVELARVSEITASGRL